MIYLLTTCGTQFKTKQTTRFLILIAGGGGGGGWSDYLVLFYLNTYFQQYPSGKNLTYT